MMLHSRRLDVVLQRGAQLLQLFLSFRVQIVIPFPLAQSRDGLYPVQVLVDGLLIVRLAGHHSGVGVGTWDEGLLNLVHLDGGRMGDSVDEGGPRMGVRGAAGAVGCRSFPP